MRPELLEPRRVRYPRGAYGWVDLRIVTDGHLQGLGAEAALIYLFLCTVGDRQGISFWSRPKMARVLNLTPEEVDTALARLTTADLVAVKDRVVQVLPVPDGCGRHLVPHEGNQQTAEVGPAREAQLCPSTKPQLVPELEEPEVSDDEIRDQEARARAQVARFLGRREPSASIIRGVARGLALAARRTATANAAGTPGGDGRE